MACVQCTNPRDPEGHPVFEAVMRCHSECLADILERDPAAINAVYDDVWKRTPIHMIPILEGFISNPVEILEQVMFFPDNSVSPILSTEVSSSYLWPSSIGEGKSV